MLGDRHWPKTRWGPAWRLTVWITFANPASSPGFSPPSEALPLPTPTPPCLSKQREQMERRLQAAAKGICL